MGKRKSNFGVFEVIIIVLIIIVFIISLGKLDISVQSDVKDNESDEEIKNLSKLQYRHKKLKDLIKKKEQLNIKLNKRFKRIYFSVRFVLALIYVGYNTVLYFAFEIKELGDLLNWNQLAVVVFALFSFITFGAFSNVREFIQSIKMKLEIKTYSKYIDINEQIELHKEEEKILTSSIAEVQIKLTNPKS